MLNNVYLKVVIGHIVVKVGISICHTYSILFVFKTSHLCTYQRIFPFVYVFLSVNKDGGEGSANSGVC